VCVRISVCTCVRVCV